MKLKEFKKKQKLKVLSYWNLNGEEFEIDEMETQSLKYYHIGI